MAWYRATLTGTYMPGPRVGHTFIHIPSPSAAVSMSSEPNARPIPTPGHCALFGGYDGTECVNTVDMFSVDSMSWSALTCVGDVPKPRTGHCCAHIGGGHIVVFGGRDANQFFHDGYTLDLVTASWTKIRNRDDPDGQSSPAIQLAEAQMRHDSPKSFLSLSQSNWVTVPLDNLEALAESSCVVQNGRVLFWGGSGLDGHTVDNFMGYDPREGVFYQIIPPETASDGNSTPYLPAPPPRVGHQFVARPDVSTLLLTGGVSQTLLDVWNAHKDDRGGMRMINWRGQPDAPLRVYDTKTCKWFPPLTEVQGAANLNRRCARRGHVASLTPTGIVVQGGVDFDGISLERYVPDTVTGAVLNDWHLIHPWTLQGLNRPVAETPGSRFGHACAVALAKGAIVYGGANLVMEEGEVDEKKGKGEVDEKKGEVDEKKGVEMDGVVAGDGNGVVDNDSGPFLRCHCEVHVMAW